MRDPSELVLEQGEETIRASRLPPREALKSWVTVGASCTRAAFPRHLQARPGPSTTSSRAPGAG